jgi:hypothetical protein
VRPRPEYASWGVQELSGARWRYWASRLGLVISDSYRPDLGELRVFVGVTSRITWTNQHNDSAPETARPRRT